MQLNDVRAIVTGGASGLGLAAARYLAGKGAKLALFDLSEERGQAAAAELGAHFFRADVSNEAEISAQVAAAHEALGGLNAAINCAGILGAGRVLGKDGPMPLSHSASKGGVVGMTLPMAREFARVGIRVMTVAPGVFHTPMVDGMPEQVYASLCAQVPFPSRLGRPDEFADAVAFVLQNSYMNGSVIRVDGAIRLAPK